MLVCKDKLMGVIADRRLDLLMIYDPLAVHFFTNLELYNSDTLSSAGIQEGNIIVGLIPDGSVFGVLRKPGDEKRLRPERFFDKTHLGPWHLDDKIGFLANIIREQMGSKGRLGIDLSRFPSSVLVGFQSALPGVEFVNITTELDFIRTIKPEKYLDHIVHAARAMEDGIRALAQIMRNACDAGQELCGQDLIIEFSKIVTERGCLSVNLPHGIKRTDRLRPNSGTVFGFDYVAQYEGFYADFARGLAMGREPDASKQKLYSQAWELIDIITGILKPGMPFRDAHDAIHDASQKHFEGQPPFDFFVHGIGLTVHQPPMLNPFHHIGRCMDGAMAEGTVFVAEILGFTEEMYVMEKEGPRSLMTLPRTINPYEY